MAQDSNPDILSERNKDKNYWRELLSYHGDRDDHLRPEASRLTWVVDSLAILVFTLLFYRNLDDVASPMALTISLFAAAYLGLIMIRPTRLNHWRVLLLSAAAIGLAVVAPIHDDEHVLTGAYVAVAGCIAVFVVRGTLAALAVAAGYFIYVAFMLRLPAHGFSDPSDNVIALASLATVMVTILMVIHHYTVRLERSNRALAKTAAQLQQATDGLHYAAAAGAVGIWSYRPDEDLWNANQIFRELLGLPEREYPKLTTELLLSRLDPAQATGFVTRMQSGQDSEFELIDVIRPDGKKFACQVMSKVYNSHGSSILRRGVLVEINT